MLEIFNRVAKWNNARYEQEFDLALTVKLLREEHREWLEATTRVDQVHELCDVIYVAMGATWKLKDELDASTVDKMFDYVDNVVEHFREPGVLTSATIDVLEFTPVDEGTANFLVNLFAITLFAQAQLLTYGLTYDQIVQCMHVLCDSNDSKSVKKTASTVKANSNDKGTYYKSPIPGLKAIIGALH